MNTQSTSQDFIKKAKNAINNADFDQAGEYCEKALELDIANWKAYYLEAYMNDISKGNTDIENTNQSFS